MSQFLDRTPPSATAGDSSRQQIAQTTETPRLPAVDGVYRTEPRRVPWRRRMFPSLSFYPRFWSIVLRAAAQAKRGHYSGADWAASCRAVVRTLESVGVELEIEGLDRVAKLDGPFVVAGNHMSTLETSSLPAALQPICNTTFVVKDRLVETPIFKYVMRSRNPVVVTQENPREDLKVTLSEGADRLAQGTVVIVFPEGTRTATFDPARFNSIGVKLAGRAGVPIVPLALITDAWALGPYIADVGWIDPSKKVHIAFGEPMQVDGRGVAQQQAIVDFISERLAHWYAEDGRTAPTPSA